MGSGVQGHGEACIAAADLGGTPDWISAHSNLPSHRPACRRQPDEPRQTYVVTHLGVPGQGRPHRHLRTGADVTAASSRRERRGDRLRSGRRSKGATSSSPGTSRHSPCRVIASRARRRASSRTPSCSSRTSSSLSSTSSPGASSIATRRPRMVLAEGGAGWLPWRPGSGAPPCAALGDKEVLGRQGWRRPRHEAERPLQAADLHDLPGRRRGDGAHSVLR